MTETRPGNSALDPGLLVKPSSTLSLSAPQSPYLQKGLDRIVSGADILGLFFHCPLRVAGVWGGDSWNPPLHRGARCQLQAFEA